MQPVSRCTCPLVAVQLSLLLLARHVGITSRDPTGHSAGVSGVNTLIEHGSAAATTMSMSAASEQAQDVALRRNLTKIFEKFDADGSGAVSITELAAMVKEMRMQLDDEQLKQMMVEADTGKSGNIDFEEFVASTKRQIASGNGGGLGEALLRSAAIKGDDEFVITLLNAGVDVDATDPANGMTALHLASYNGHPLTTQFLIERGAVVNTRTGGGRTALDLAKQQRHSEVIKKITQAQQAARRAREAAWMAERKAERDTAPPKPPRFTEAQLKKIWAGCIGLGLLLAVIGVVVLPAGLLQQDETSRLHPSAQFALVSGGCSIVAINHHGAEQRGPCVDLYSFK